MASKNANVKVLQQFHRELINQAPTEILLGTDTLDFEYNRNQSARTFLRTLHKEHPAGILLKGFSSGKSLMLRCDLLASTLATDTFGIRAIGLAATGMQLLEFAMNPKMTKDLGSKSIDRLEASFRASAKIALNGKGTTQVHAIRWGVTAKICASDNVKDHTLEINPNGPVAQSLANEFRCTVPELQGKFVKAFRHPFLISAVFQIHFNVDVRPHLIQGPRIQMRKVLRLDCDGDQLALFPIYSQSLAHRINAEDYASVPDLDPGLLVRGKDHMHEDIGTSGENIYDGHKTTQAKLTQTFTKSNQEWVDMHVQMADLTNRLTPFSYRMADISACISAVEDPTRQQNYRNAAITGSLLEEDFYLSGTGATEEMNAALDTWWRFPDMSQATQDFITAGLATECNEELLTKGNLKAIFNASRVNKQRFHFSHPTAPADVKLRDALAHIIWCIGKGQLLNAHPDALAVIHNLNAQGIPMPNNENLMVRLAAYTAQEVTRLLQTMNFDADASHEAF